MKGNQISALCAIFLGGCVALSWEVLWQLHAALAIGVSAQATAMVIAITMAGMSLGTLIAGKLLRSDFFAHRSLQIYGLLELAIGIFGVLLGPSFLWLRRVDAYVYEAIPNAAAILHLCGIVLVLGPASVAMGATLPCIGLVGQRLGLSISLLYGLNTLGAALGTLLMAFEIIPALGMNDAAKCLTALNVLVCALLLLLSKRLSKAVPNVIRVNPDSVLGTKELSFAFLSGFSVFALEVAWFRAMRSAFLSTTFSFAVMLSAVLLALGVAAHAARRLKPTQVSYAQLFCISGASVFIVTPLLDRLDILAGYYVLNPHLSRFLLSFALVGPVVATVGIIFPRLLDQFADARSWSFLHSVNTLGAVLGALLGAWCLLPALGFVHTALLLGLVLLVVGVLQLERSRLRMGWLAASSVLLLINLLGSSGIGLQRVAGLGANKSYQVIAHADAPDFSVAITQDQGSSHRALFIDGFNASMESGLTDYLTWMGRLPMLLHTDPRDALVICFGTGETAHSVRLEGAQHVDIVDISQTVFSMAKHFPSNEGILDDPKVRPIVMDGRAWMQRAQRSYDVITLEPMPPTFAGMNSLYSREFYQLARERLRAEGSIAQWLPLHLMTPEQARAVARTFIEVFPNALLWIHPNDKTGILLGKKSTIPASVDPGLARTLEKERPFSNELIANAVRLDARGLKRYAQAAALISDDNQYLAYGWDSRQNFTAGPITADWVNQGLRAIEAARVPSSEDS